MKRLTSGVMAVNISPNKRNAFVLSENYTEDFHTHSVS
jgi:hypothetical protein